MESTESPSAIWFNDIKETYDKCISGINESDSHFSLNASHLGADQIKDLDYVSLFKETEQDSNASVETKQNVKNKLIELLDKITKEVSTNSTSRLLALSSFINYRIGLFETEVARGKARFETALSDRIINDQSYCLLTIKLYNNLASGHAEEGNADTAEEILKRAYDVYRHYKKNYSEPPADPYKMVFLGESEPNSEGWNNLEAASCYSLYYLAQVNTKQSKSELALASISLALKKALNIEEIKGLFWIDNCLALIYRLISFNAYSLAKSGICSCKYLLKVNEQNIPQEGPDDIRRQTDYHKGSLANASIKYGLSLLLASQGLREGVDEFQDQSRNLMKPFLEESESFEFIENEEIRVFSKMIPSEYAKNFEEARALFLLVQCWIDEAEKIFPIDEHCSTYADLQLNYAQAFKILATFEEDLARKCSMHKRQIGILNKVLLQLNPDHYLALCRKMLFQLGEAYVELIIVKQTLATNIQAKLKINALISKGVNVLERFIKTYNVSVIGDLTLDKFSVTDINDILNGYLYLGRCFSKYNPKSREDEISSIESTLRCYTFIVEYVKANPTVEHGLFAEVEQLFELVELLSKKLAVLSASK